MARNLSFGLLAALVLAACAPRVQVEAPRPGDLSGEIVAKTGDRPPAAPEGACWADEHLPAVYETVTEQSLVTPEVRDDKGNVVSPASYHSVSRLSVVREAREVWFRSPCPDEMTLPFIATLQRALKARGYYLAEVTGTMDAATAEALRRYQADHGLDTAQLSLAASRDLGLSTTALTEP